MKILIFEVLDQNFRVDGLDQLHGANESSGVFTMNFRSPVDFVFRSGNTYFLCKTTFGVFEKQDNVLKSVEFRAKSCFRVLSSLSTIDQASDFLSQLEIFISDWIKTSDQ